MAQAFLPWFMVALAAGFAVITGANDGGVLVAMGVRFSMVRLATFIAILFAVLVGGPLVIGTAVARTVASGLVDAHAPGSAISFTVGVSVAVVVVAILSHRGLPTSLTLALIGGLAGAGCGSDVAVDWQAVGRVLGIGLAAPVIGWAVGRGLDRAARRMPPWRRTPAAVRRTHVAAFTLQCLAYAANDGQKMLAVAAVAAVALPGHYALLSTGGLGLQAVTLVAIAVLFIVGTLWTLRTVSTRLARGLVQVYPLDAVVAQLSAAGAVLSSSALGAPVSMSQSLAAALVGVAGSKGVRRVRWRSAIRIAAAWAVTLPAALVPAFGVAAAVGAIGD